VIKVIEHDGTAPVAQDYDAFGAADGAVAKNGPGFNGAPSVDGFQYLRNRWYDPNVGRFTQEDPIGFAGGINLYAYAGSDPVGYSDPYGLCPKYAGGDDKTPGAEDCSKDVVRQWAASHITYHGVQSRDADPRVVDAVARASIANNTSVNISSLQRLPGNPDYSASSLHSTSPARAADISAIGANTVSELVSAGRTREATAFQEKVEQFAGLGGRLHESFGPERYFKPSLGGIFTPSARLRNDHQDHIHIGIGP
jgi:RHS repeat-associated protein